MKKKVEAVYQPLIKTPEHSVEWFDDLAEYVIFDTERREVYSSSEPSAIFDWLRTHERFSVIIEALLQGRLNNPLEIE